MIDHVRMAFCKGNMVICNVCRQSTDSYVTGAIQGNEDVHRFAYCTKCVDDMKRAADAKYRPVAGEKRETYVSEVWSTPTDES